MLLRKVNLNSLSQFGKLVLTNHTVTSNHPAPLKLTTPIQVKKVLIRYYCEAKSEEGEEQQGKITDATKDRSKVIPVEVSIQYLKSSAYQTTYGDEPIWTHYRRNHKGELPPEKTRKRCIRGNRIATGNPCPICRDEYLVLHPKNTDLLKQFISPHTGEILSYQITGVCQRRHQELLVAIMQAKDLGLITFDLPFQPYDYSEYVDLEKLKAH